jgi:anaerobic magnesium-protoporphyrin IX monomethyl ester cyclase
VIVDALGEAPFHQVSCFDDRMIAIGLPIADIVARIPGGTELVGISCMFSQDWPYAQMIVKAVRQRFPHALIVGGGEHITALPLHTLDTCPEIDVCALGEGEDAIVEIADCVATGADLGRLAGIALRLEGRPTQTAARVRLKDVDAIPPPAWDLTPIANYLNESLGYGVDLGRSMPVLATRGCPYQCTFCSNPAMWTTRWYARDPALVLDEIQDYVDRFKATNIDFYDLTAIVKKKWILSFCEMIEQRGMKFTWQLPSGTRSEAIDAEVSRVLYRAGCRNMTYAPESGSPAVLKRIKKKVSLSNLMKSMRGAIREGTNVKTNIIIGFPDETRREVWQTIAFVARMAIGGVHDVSVSLFSPYPGSELFDQLRRQGRLSKLDEDYFISLASYTDVTTTVSWCENLSSRELSMLRLFALFSFYALQYLVRPWRPLRTLYNVLSNRQESRLDKSLHDFLQRRAASRKSPPIESPPIAYGP